MKGPGIKDYLKVLEEKKKKAHEEGWLYLDITSKKLHEEISPEHATMPTCCQAMYKVALEGDEIIEKPKGNTGFGSHLTIRYYVDNLEGRQRIYPDKKRGRPCKSEEEKLITKRKKRKCNTEDLSKLVSAWLLEQGYEFEENKEYIEASNGNEKRLINIQGIKRGRKQTLPLKLSEVLKKMDDESIHYSLALNDSISYRRQWNEIPKNVKERLKMSIILADKKGNIHEL
ncbi:MAG: AT hook domain-containing protein [Erysipelotrichia bacterium]|nr:AT hook domain-containing protein [Erysipelotrichia bacterium]